MKAKLIILLFTFFILNLFAVDIYDKCDQSQ